MVESSRVRSDAIRISISTSLTMAAGDLRLARMWRILSIAEPLTSYGDNFSGYFAAHQLRNEICCRLMGVMSQGVV